MGVLPKKYGIWIGDNISEYYLKVRNFITNSENPITQQVSIL
jgi:hypothetical protein